MSPLVALVVGLLLGGAVAATVILRSRPDPAVDGDTAVAALPEAALARRLLDLMDPAVVIVDVDDAVLLANPAARALGIVRGTRLLVPDLLALARTVRSGGSRRVDVRLPGDLVGSGPRLMGVHGVRLHSGTVPLPGPVALVLQDVTETRRSEAVRRDFVANVGHELKTPVGALSLLAEAIEQAADDPEAVQRFAGRMSHEADRLSRLVRELIDLSRLQGGEPLPELEPVEVDRVIAEAVDRTRTAARAKSLDIAVGGEHGLVVRGVESQLSTAVTNLLANAVAYSTGREPDRGGRASAGRASRRSRSPTAASASRARTGSASSSASTASTSRGRAVPEGPASAWPSSSTSRATTAGAVSVWSEEGLGSTFTLRIPLDASATRHRCS